MGLIPITRIASSSSRIVLAPRSAHIAVAYYYYPFAGCGRTTCQLDVGFISSATGTTSWSSAAQLAGPMSLGWLPSTTQGFMVGDYISTSYANGTAHALFAVATAPTGASGCLSASPGCHQALVTNASGLALHDDPLRSSDDTPIAGVTSDHARPASPIILR